MQNQAKTPTARPILSTLAIIGSLFTGFAWADVQAQDRSQVEADYKQQYAHQVGPMLRRQFEAAGANTDKDFDQLASEIAGCQLAALADYPDAYWQDAVIPVIQGQPVGAVTQAMNERMQEDVASGELSETDFESLTQAGVTKFTTCVETVQAKYAAGD